MFFLVECYATLYPALSVGWSVSWLIPLLLFGVFELFEPTTPAQMPCPPASDRGGCVFGLVFLKFRYTIHIWCFFNVLQTRRLTFFPPLLQFSSPFHIIFLFNTFLINRSLKIRKKTEIYEYVREWWGGGRNENFANSHCDNSGTVGIGNLTRFFGQAVEELMGQLARFRPNNNRNVKPIRDLSQSA